MRMRNRKAKVPEWLAKVVLPIIVFLIILGGLYLLLRYFGIW